MKLKGTYKVAAILSIIGLVVLFWRINSRVDSSYNDSDEFVAGGEIVTFDRKEPELVSNSAEIQESNSLSDRPDQTHYETVQQGLEGLFDGLQKMGRFKETPSISEALSQAVGTGDSGVILRAFNEAIYGRFAKMSETIPALKFHLNSSEPYIRYLAAERLLQVGDDTGVAKLLGLLQSDEAILHEERDLRLSVASLLGKYGDIRAAPGLIKLYEKTKKAFLLNDLIRIERSNVSLITIERIIEQETPSFIAFNLGLSRSQDYQEIIRKTFEDPKVPSIYIEKTRITAAWALARMTQNDEYLAYLSETARPFIEKEKFSGENNISTKALKYLGSIQSSQAVQVLEATLESKNGMAVRYAMVNLLFNQPGGSKKAEQLLLEEFKTSPKRLGSELAMQIASKLDNDEIKKAAESYARRTGKESWRYWGVERSNWPLQNWINDYVVVLNDL